MVTACYRDIHVYMMNMLYMLILMYLYMMLGWSPLSTYKTLHVYLQKVYRDFDAKYTNLARLLHIFKSFVNMS